MGFDKIHKKAFALIFLDLILINISLGAAFLLRYDLKPYDIPGEILQDCTRLALIATLMKVIVFYFFKLYNSIWEYASIHEMVLVIGSSFVSNGILLVLFKLLSVAAHGSVLAITVLTDIFLIGGVRFTYRGLRRIVYRYSICKENLKRILVIGNGEFGSTIVKEVKEHPELKSIPIAIIDDDKEKTGRKINGVPIVGQFGDIINVVHKKRIDEIIIALPSFSKKMIDDLYQTCLRTGCRVKILPSFTQLINESYVMPKIRNVDIEDLLGREPVNLKIDEISACLEKKVVLVTGGGGSIGSELCRQISLFKPKLLVMLDIYENNLYDIENELLYMYPQQPIAAVIASIREKERLTAVFDLYKPDVVFHAAAHKHVPLMEENPGEAIKNNIFGTLNVAECSDQYKVKKFVLISSDKAVNPTSVMGATKRVAEMIIQTLNKNSSTEFVAVRFGNVLGSNGSVIPLFKKQIERGGPVTITHPDVTRYFMTIPEAVHLVIQAGTMAKGGEIFVLDMGSPVKIYDLAKKLITLSGFEPDTDIKFKFIGLRPGEKMFEELILEEEGLTKTQINKIFVTKPIYTDFEVLRHKIVNILNINASNRNDVMDYLKEIISLNKGNEN